MQNIEKQLQKQVKREMLAAKQMSLLVELLEQNTKLTELTQQLSQRIDSITSEIHEKLITVK